ncbi:MAG: 2-oxoacid:ferredoxin oxidoreductase subunit beta [Rhodospirillaceae bacterium]|nr:2-oxoacid:ferredoxin oxidoreductase subunit beta [Rhodospirillaceae bacterium]
MSYIRKPAFQHPNLPKNEIGLTRRDYEGAMSTLCAGCGHDSVSAAIIEACYALGVEPHRLAKLSGIGCSSKTPTYFLSKSHGFNSVHGRMPSIATGASMANTGLKYIGVSGDGDSASIGLGQFAHAIRRQVNMLYIIENNGTYGLTKGQFSATNDRASVGRKGQKNQFDPIDICSLAIQLGASFVARGFSGDKAQLVPLIESGMAHEGFALIDVVSPCVTFNNHLGSTKSFDFVREHNNAVMATDFVPAREQIHAEYDKGEAVDVQLHDDCTIRLRKLDDDYDPTDRASALKYLADHHDRGEVVTGLLHVDTGIENLRDKAQLVDQPLNELVERDLVPSQALLDEVNQRRRW